MQSIEQRIAQKRLIGEMNDLNKNRVHCYQVIQDLKNQHLFYFLLRGNDDDAYAGGYYMGKIELPPDYPKKPGYFYMLTPSGRFTTDSKICLTNSGYHLETWTAMWSIRLMMLGFFSIFCSDDTTGISHIKELPQSRKQKAQNSISFNMANYPAIFKRFDQYFKEDGTMRTTEKEIGEYIAQLQKQSHDMNKKKKKHRKQKEEVKEDVKEYVKEQVKEDVKEQVKEEVKKEVEEDVKGDMEEYTKKVKSKKTDNNGTDVNNDKKSKKTKKIKDTDINEDKYEKTSKTKTKKEKKVNEEVTEKVEEDNKAKKKKKEKKTKDGDVEKAGNDNKTEKKKREKKAKDGDAEKAGNDNKTNNTEKKKKEKKTKDGDVGKVKKVKKNI